MRIITIILFGAILLSQGQALFHDQEPANFKQSLHSYHQNIDDTITVQGFQAQDFYTIIEDFIYQMLNEVVLFNVNDCSYYIFMILNDSVEAVASFSNLQFWDGTLSVFTAIHRGPVAFNYCLKLYDTYYDMLYAYQEIIFTSWKTTLFSCMLNVAFNAVDIYQELEVMYHAAQSSDWGQFGKFTAKVISDLILKNPLDDSWNFRNSESIRSGLYRELDISRYITTAQYDFRGKSVHSERDAKIRQLTSCIKEKGVIEDMEDTVGSLISGYSGIQQTDEITSWDHQIDSVLALMC